MLFQITDSDGHMLKWVPVCLHDLFEVQHCKPLPFSLFVCYSITCNCVFQEEPSPIGIGSYANVSPQKLGELYNKAIASTWPKDEHGVNAYSGDTVLERVLQMPAFIQALKLLCKLPSL